MFVRRDLKARLHLAQFIENIGVILGFMRQGARGAILDAVGGIAAVAAAVGQGVERTVTKQAIEIIRVGNIVARKPLARGVAKKGGTGFHSGSSRPFITEYTIDITAFQMRFFLHYGAFYTIISLIIFK